MNQAVKILKDTQNQLAAEYHRVIYSIHYGKLIGKDEAELAEIRKTARDIWTLLETITELTKEQELERVEA